MLTLVDGQLVPVGHETIEDVFLLAAYCAMVQHDKRKLEPKDGVEFIRTHLHKSIKDLDN